MIAEFQNLINKKLHLPRNYKLLLAVSGGVDSIVMTHLFHKSGISFSIAHCNFQLRKKESDDDEQFVKAYAKKLKAKFHAKKFETKSFANSKKLSTQVAARQLRYGWFYQLLEKFNYDFIAVAHHQTDVLETMLINLIRGTGISGIHGILPLQDKIIRPLLFASHNEIIAYAKKEKLKWREDSSNAEDVYVRNKIRLHILPLLKEINPSVEKTFAENAERFHDAELLIDSFLPLLKKEFTRSKKIRTEIKISKLLSHSQPRALLYFLLRDFNFKNNLTDEIFESLKGLPGKQFFSETHQALKDRDNLIITPLQPVAENKPDDSIIIGSQDERYIGDDFIIRLNKIKRTDDTRLLFINSPGIAYFDADKITFPLRLRKWQRGDYFYPLGMNGKRKKLSDYFIDMKLSLIEKQHIWLVLSGDEICWIAGKRIDERFKVTDDSKKLLKLTYSQKS